MVRSPLALRCSREQNALHTLIRHRHLTPSCGGHVPTAERTLDPARMFMESLTTGPELKNSQGHSRPMWPIYLPVHVRFAREATDVLRCREMTRCASSDISDDTVLQQIDLLASRSATINSQGPDLSGSAASRNATSLRYQSISASCAACNPAVAAGRRRQSTAAARCRFLGVAAAADHHYLETTLSQASLRFGQPAFAFT